jgi:hypothetical protein
LDFRLIEAASYVAIAVSISLVAYIVAAVAGFVSF